MLKIFADSSVSDVNALPEMVFLKNINLGIIGLGYQGKVHLKNSLHLKGVKVLDAADAADTALNYAKRFGVRKVYKNYEDLLKDDQLDAVIISLPNFLHSDCAVKAAEAGKDIFLEKPLARNLEEGERIVSSIRRNNVKAMIGFNLRFNPILRKVREELNSGIFGDVQMVEATNVSSGPFSHRSNRVGPVPVSSWWFDKDLVGGGALLDLGSHWIDLLRWYFGEADCLNCHLGFMFNMDVEDAATCLLKFKKGPIATVKVGWFSKDFMQSVQICGTARNKYVQISNSNALVNVWRDVKRKLGLHDSDPYYLELEYFVKCLQMDEKPYPSEEDGLSCLKLISSAYEKARREICEYRKAEV
jgi:predicted dehydrogenase